MSGVLVRAIVEELRSDPNTLRDLAVALEPYREPAASSGQRGEYLTVEEAAETLRCKPQRIHDLLSARKLTRVKEGGRTLLLREEVESRPESST